MSTKATKKIKVTMVDRDGNETQKTVDKGTKISALNSADALTILNGRDLCKGTDPELRAGDTIQHVRRSYKNGNG